LTGFLNPAVMKRYDSFVGSLKDSAAVSGDHDRGPSQMGASKKDHDFFSEIRVQIASGLIGQKDERILDECPRNGDALLFPPRQLKGERTPLARQANGSQRLVCPLADERPPLACHLKGEGHVLVDSPCGDELEILENKPDLPPQQGKPVSAYPAEIDTVDQYLTARWAFGAENQPEKGRLAGAAWPGDKDELSLLDVQVQILKRLRAAEALMKTKQMYHLGGIEIFLLSGRLWKMMVGIHASFKLDVLEIRNQQD
jgi:hypothetical protein